MPLIREAIRIEGETPPLMAELLPRAGTHAVDVITNDASFPSGSFEVLSA